MKRKQVGKAVINMGMAALLPFLMLYEYFGHAFHEWIGCAMFVLFILHLAANRKWFAAVGRGRYMPFRVVQTVIDVLITCCMFGSMVSGILLSQTVFTFLDVHADWASAIHMLCAYWGFVLMSLHLGIQGGIIRNRMQPARPDSGEKPSTGLAGRIAGVCIALYGLGAFIRRDFPMYMIRRYHFAMYRYDEPLVIWLIDYLCIMGLFAGIGYLLAKRLRGNAEKRRKK